MSSSDPLGADEVVCYLELTKRLDAMARTRPERSASLHLELARIRRLRTWGQIRADACHERMRALSSAVAVVENEVAAGTESWVDQPVCHGTRPWGPARVTRRAADPGEGR